MSRGPQVAAEVYEWTREVCRALGITIVAPIEHVHVQPWSTVLRVPTSHGAVYVKCCGPTQRHEPRLTALLHREFPGHVPEVLGVQAERSWMLVAEGGTKLGATFAGDDLLRAWRRILPRYAELQRAVTPRTGDILAFGTPDHRATALAVSFERVVRDEGTVSGERSDRLSTEERGDLLSLVPTLRARLAALAALGVDDALQHDDLHHGNVLVRGGRSMIFDWGDSCVSHPFLTLAVTLRFAAEVTGRSISDAAILALRDAYLEPWADRASPPELRDAAELGRRIGEVSRALTFDAVARAYPGVNDAYPGGLAGSLRRVRDVLG